MHQKALVLRSRLGTFAVTTLPVPTPGSGEVLVKIHSAGLNPVDWNIQKRGMFVTYFPAVIGSDIAGEVVEVGANVSSSLAVGDRVFFQGTFANSYAGFQQYALAEVNTLAKIPASMSFDQAATMPLTCTTAYLSLYNAVPYGLGLENPIQSPGKYSGTPIVILGGSSSVGQFAIQFANASGFNPIITTSSLKHEQHLLSLGATHVLGRNMSLESLKEAVQQITPVPIRFVCDAISATDTQHTGMGVLAPGGNLVLVRESVFEDGFEDKSISTVLALKNLPQNVNIVREMWAYLAYLLEEGLIKPLRTEVLSGGLRGIEPGLKKLENGQVSGIKVVVHPQETASSYS